MDVGQTDAVDRGLFQNGHTVGVHKVVKPFQPLQGNGGLFGVGVPVRLVVIVEMVGFYPILALLLVGGAGVQGKKPHEEEAKEHKPDFSAAFHEIHHPLFFEDNHFPLIIIMA